MDSQLTLLISFYEEEKAQLQKDLEVYLIEKEYLMAHYKSAALGKVNRKLWVLHNMDDTLYSRKSLLRDRIEAMEKGMASEAFLNMQEVLNEQIKESKIELEKLNQLPVEKVPAIMGETFLDKTLKRLLHKEIKNLKLVLNKNKDLHLRFSYTKSILNITIPDVHKHCKHFVIYEDNLVVLENLGFQLSASGNRLTLSLTGDKTEILSQVKVILCKIIFEIFALIGFRNESFLCYNEKPAKKSER